MYMVSKVLAMRSFWVAFGGSPLMSGLQGGACATLASRACSAGVLRTGQGAAGPPPPFAAPLRYALTSGATPRRFAVTGVSHHLRVVPHAVARRRQAQTAARSPHRR